MARRLTLVLFSCFITFASPALAQSARDRFEIGVALGAIDFRESLHEKPLATLVRFGYRLTRISAIDAEIAVCPQNPSGNFGQVLIVAGPKAGIAVGPVSVMGKVRAGAIVMAGRAFRAHNGGTRIEPAIDAGVIIELAASSYAALRIDAGRTFVPFGTEPIGSGLPPYSRTLGTTVNPHGSVGIQFRF